jgi:hypothetical protein
MHRMQKVKYKLEEQVPAYGLEALVSVIDDNNVLIAALKNAGEHFSVFNRQKRNLHTN